MEAKAEAVATGGASPQRTAIVTGASSGIGQQVAMALVAQGWRVIGTGRDPGRMDRAAQAIAACADGGEIIMLPADLALIAGADALADQIAARTDRIDLLVNNAGGMSDRLEMTAEGLEANFAGNHLGPFHLTRRLLPLLESTAARLPPGAVRILMTASDASEMGPGIDLADMQCLANWNPGLAYCTGKLANVLFARALAQRLAETGIVAHAMAPGATDSNFTANAPESTRAYMRSLALNTEAQGADTLIWLATCAEAGSSSGGYWEHRAPRPPHPAVEDAALVAAFWQASESLADGALHVRP